MTTKQKIVNQALGHLGQDPTDTLVPSEATSATRKLLPFVDSARDEVLSRHPWVSALRYVSLSLSGDGPDAGDWRYPYLYLMPADCLRVVEVATPGFRWEAGTRLKADDAGEDRVIRSAHPGPLPIAYVRAIDWAVMPSHIERPLGLMLAGLACMAVTGDGQRGLKLADLAEQAMLKALDRDGTQQGERPPLFPDPYGELRRSAG